MIEAVTVREHGGVLCVYHNGLEIHREVRDHGRNAPMIGDQVRRVVESAVRPTSDPRNWHLGTISHRLEWVAVYVGPDSRVA